MSISNEIIAMILGGGAGSRLAPLTSSRSKPAVPIAGKYRLVDIPISNCINSEIIRMFVLTQFNSASLNRHIKNTYRFSAFSTAFVDILAAEQTPDNPAWYQGTADAVRQCLRHLTAFPSEYVLILSGDQLYQMDFNLMLENHKKCGADISIATIPVGDREAPEFGILKVDENNLIASFVEKPAKESLGDWVSDTGTAMQQKGRNYLASMGIYIFNRKLLLDLLLKIHPDATDFGKEIIPSSITDYKVASYQYDGYWTDIGNIYSFFEAISKTGIIDFFPNPFMKESFLKKIELQAPYIELISEEEPYQPLFNFEFGIGKIQPAFVVHLPKLLPAWQEFLLQHNKLINSAFLFSKLVEAKQIVFCDGVEGNRNPYFSLLPFALNKGEALIIEAPEVSNEFIYKKSVALVPYGKDGLFWAGSNYIWDFDDDQPTETFRKSTEVALKNWLKVPFKILEHKAAIRPATVERRPFVGFHPKFQNVGILNGLGTKGCSLAPYFAHQLSDHIINGTGIEKEADLGRFSGILSRTSL